MKRYINAASFISLNHKQLDMMLGMRGLEDQFVKDFLLDDNDGNPC